MSRIFKRYCTICSEYFETNDSDRNHCYSDECIDFYRRNNVSVRLPRNIKLLLEQSSYLFYELKKSREQINIIKKEIAQSQDSTRFLKYRYSL